MARGRRQRRSSRLELKAEKELKGERQGWCPRWGGRRCHPGATFSNRRRVGQKRHGTWHSCAGARGQPSPRTSAMAMWNRPPGAYDPSASRSSVNMAVNSVPALPMTEPKASADRSRRSDRGKRTKTEVRMIHGLGRVSRAGAPG
eukprot:scaffold14620_cov82-Isochrysis_galbana.AAC.1